MCCFGVVNIKKRTPQFVGFHIHTGEQHLRSISTYTAEAFHVVIIHDYSPSLALLLHDSLRSESATPTSYGQRDAL